MQPAATIKEEAVPAKVKQPEVVRVKEEVKKQPVIAVKEDPEQWGRLVKEEEPVDWASAVIKTKEIEQEKKTQEQVKSPVIAAWGNQQAAKEEPVTQAWGVKREEAPVANWAAAIIDKQSKAAPVKEVAPVVQEEPKPV